MEDYCFTILWWFLAYMRALEDTSGKVSLRVVYHNLKTRFLPLKSLWAAPWYVPSLSVWSLLLLSLRVWFAPLSAPLRCLMFRCQREWCICRRSTDWSCLGDPNYHWPQDSSLEKAMASHSSTLAWKIPWTEEPGRLQSMGSLRVRHDWATSLSLFTCMHWKRKWQPTPVFLPGESQGRGSLVGCRLWGRTGSDTTDAAAASGLLISPALWSSLLFVWNWFLFCGVREDEEVICIKSPTTEK